MFVLSAFLTILGLCVFETISSVDNAIINAEVLSTMSARARRWFLIWGLFIAVFMIRGLLPWIIVWATTPTLGPIEAFTATFSEDPNVTAAMAKSAPILLMGGGVFLVLLFWHWLLLEDKKFGLRSEHFFYKHGSWFHASAALILFGLLWFTITDKPLVALSAVIGYTAFFITHGIKHKAEQSEKKLMHSKSSDISKIIYLEMIDASFSIDGVLGAFAFTLSVPLILLGNGLGAFVVRELTIHNIERVKRYVFLKNGAMYSILFLGAIMILESFGYHIPSWVSPVTTIGVISFFFIKSLKHLKLPEEQKKK